MTTNFMELRLIIASLFSYRFSTDKFWSWQEFRENEGFEYLLRDGKLGFVAGALQISRRIYGLATAGDRTTSSFPRLAFGSLTVILLRTLKSFRATLYSMDALKPWRMEDCCWFGKRICAVRSANNFWFWTSGVARHTNINPAKEETLIQNSI